MFESLEVLIGVAVFIIIMIISRDAIEEGLKITGAPSWILAACVAALAIIGMAQPTGDAPAMGKTRDFILLPYIIWGLMCILAVLLGLLFRSKRRKEWVFRWLAKKNKSDNERTRKTEFGNERLKK